MFKTTRKRQKAAPVAYKIETKDVVLEALCAYRDDLLMSDSYGTIETQMKLLALHVEINELLLNKQK